jgi:hypothetical protein
MWKKIESLHSVLEVQTGFIISKNPDEDMSEFEIMSISEGYVGATHIHNTIPLKVFPVNFLFRDNWWIKV